MIIILDMFFTFKCVCGQVQSDPPGKNVADSCFILVTHEKALNLLISY